MGWQRREAKPTPHPPVTLCPPRNVCVHPGSPRTPLSPPQVCLHHWPCAGCGRDRGDAYRGMGEHGPFLGLRGCPRCPSSPCCCTSGRLLPRAAAEAAPAGRRCSIGTPAPCWTDGACRAAQGWLLGLLQKGPPCPLQAGGQAAGPSPEGVELLACLVGSGSGVASRPPSPAPGLLEQEEGPWQSSGSPGHGTVGPTNRKQCWAHGATLPGQEFLQGAGHGACLGACPGDTVPKVQHLARGSSEA